MTICLPALVNADVADDSLKSIVKKSQLDSNASAKDSIYSKSPDGFNWQTLKDINTAILMPVDWHFFQDSAEGETVFYFSQENVEDGETLQTGLSFFAMKNFSETRGLDSKEYFRAFVDQFTKSFDTISTSSDTSEVVWNFDVKSRHITDDKVSHIVLTRIALNSKTDTMYLLTFESLESNGEKTDEISKIMLESIKWDEET